MDLRKKISFLLTGHCNCVGKGHIQHIHPLANPSVFYFNTFTGPIKNKLTNKKKPTHFQDVDTISISLLLPSSPFTMLPQAANKA